MDWINSQNAENEDEFTMLKKIDKFTLYDHNYTSRIDLQKLTFNCIFNCKRINRKYSILGQIEGDLLAKNIQLSCSLMSFNKILCGKSHFQKTQLMKFAYKYNEKSAGQYLNKGSLSEDAHHYQIKVNPLNGQIFVCFHFFFSPEFLKDYDKFKVRLTDECEKLGSEAQKIFNTLLEIIFNEEANDPFLKSHERVGVSHSLPVKFQRLLKKVKKLSIISTRYKIKQHISGINRLRSHFKKIYLKQSQQPIHHSIVLENAFVLVPQFCKKHYDAIVHDSNPNRKKNQFITPFQDLQDNIQIQFAKHLEDNYDKNCPSLIEIVNNQLEAELSEEEILSKKEFKGVNVQVSTPSPKQYKQQIDTLKKMENKHPSLPQFFNLPLSDHIRIMEDIEGIPLVQYLSKSASTISLLTRLQLMTQICHLMKSFHKKGIGCFLDMKDLYITSNSIIKLKSLLSCYSVCTWEETNTSGKDTYVKHNDDKLFYPQNIYDYEFIVGIDQSQSMESVILDEEKKRSRMVDGLVKEKADVYCLGMVLYRILMDKFPFMPHSLQKTKAKIGDFDEEIKNLWVVDNEYFVRQGGMITKLLANLLLKCFYTEVDKRPFVEWITVILCEVKSSLESIY